MKYLAFLAAAHERVAVRRQDRVDLRIAMIDETGGLVLAAKWADGTGWPWRYRTSLRIGVADLSRATTSMTFLRVAFASRSPG